MNLVQRKLAELGYKNQSLRDEFDDWLKRSEPGAALEKHHTQIRRILRRLGAFQTKVVAAVQSVAGNDQQILARCRQLESMILEVFRIWEFFRSKLAQREVPRFEAFLYPADDFAWACYEPAQLHANPAIVSPVQLKEPPLVFLNGGSSPFTSPRNRSYQAEMVPGERLQTAEFIAELKALPVPVIGVPYYQLAHLSDALVIAHEVGHDVEDDLKLSSTIGKLIEQALATAPEDRRCAWSAWAGELFADVYGTLAVGPAFVWALADFLANDPLAVTSDTRSGPNWGAYPTDYLRILLTAQVLRTQGFCSQANQILKDWKAIYASHALIAFEQDVQPVAEALIRGPYPELLPTASAAQRATAGAKLSDVIAFSKDDQQYVETDANRLLSGLAPKCENPRLLFASVRLAYDQDPAKYISSGLTTAIIKQMPRRAGERNAGLRQATPAARLEQADQQAGEQLFDQLWRG